MAQKSTENLIQSDSSTSMDELNSVSKSHSRSIEKVSKKMFHKKKTAFVGTNSATPPTSSVTSSPQQHPVIVVGRADVHQPPKPLPRKHLTTTTFQEPVVTKRKDFTKVDDDILAISVSGESESSKSEQNVPLDKMDMELTEIRSPSGSSGIQSDKTGEPKMFFARSRKNTIVTNIDEVSVKSSSRTNKSASNLNDETVSRSKPQPKPRSHGQSLFEIVDEKQLQNGRDALAEKQSMNSNSHNRSLSSSSASETLSNDRISISEPNGSTKEKLVADGRRVNQESPVPNNYQCEKIIGIYVHSSSELKYNYNVHRPTVRCSVIDTSTGQFLRVSKTNRVEQRKEIELENVIHPIMTKGCRFVSSNKFQCQWEELLIINDNIANIMHGNEIIFFEILDSQSNESKSIFRKFAEDADGFHHICWGFLKPGDGINYSNVDKRSCLQLFRYQRGNCFRKYSMNVYDQFRLDRIKYPATLSVTVKGMAPVPAPVDNESQDFRKGGNGFEWHSCTETRQPQSKGVIQLGDNENGITNQSHFIRRLPGQICKYPNMIHKTYLESSSKGCLVSKFSPNGQFLAYSSHSDYYIQIATVPDLKVINTLRGHTNFVYDLDWLVDKRKNSFPLHLVSASSDRTAVVWTIEKDRVSLKILPHPSFLYAAKFLVNLTEDECLFAVTGGRDCAVRVWKITMDDFDLLQESVEHQNYITSIVCSTQTNNFYSSDWNGCIFEWCKQESSNNFKVTRKFPQLMDGILSIQLHPKNELRLYAQLKNHLINCLDISSQMVLNTLGTTDHDKNIRNKFTISPCGSTIYTIQRDTILIHNILSGTLESSFKLPFVKHYKSYISHLDYHPKLFLLSATVHGLNGGVVLLSHKSSTYTTDTQTEVVYQHSSDDRWMMLKDKVHPQSSQLLGNIIQRIDEILHQPQQKNQTDDHKKKNIAGMKRSDGKVDCDADVGVNKNVTQVEVVPLDLLSKSDSDSESSIGSGGTFTVKRQSLSEASNKTFTLSNKAGNVRQEVNDGTYSIEVDNNSDDTTISESM